MSAIGKFIPKSGAECREEQAASMLAASASQKTRCVMGNSSLSEKGTDEVVLYYGLIHYATHPPDGHKADAAPSLAISLARQVVCCR